MTSQQAPHNGAQVSRLRRDLGTIESYAALIGILVGAGIFRVTTEAWALSGPSVILAYLVLAPMVLATSVAYAVFLSTPLGRLPGGEYTHISRTFGGQRIAFLGVWLKIISYTGALAYLANAFADYVLRLTGGRLVAAQHRLPVALGSLVFFFLVHLFGVRWFGRLQVAMCLILGLALLVLVLPGLPAIRFHNYRPFFTHGPAGFLSCLPPLFFAYAGFESLAQTAGEVKESRRRLPRIFLWGIAATTLIFLAMSVVTFGVLPGGRLAGSTTPMSDVAEVYLQSRAAGIVTLGALMALATSLNATMLVPSRLGVILAEDHLIPAWLGNVNRRTGTPITGLALTLAGSVLLLLSGQLSLALNIAVFALVSLYFLHSLALLLLPRLNRDLAASVQVAISPGWRQAAALLSMAAMGSLILVQIRQDLQVMALKTFMERWADGSLTSLELVVVWGVLGAGLYYFASRRAAALGWISRTGTRPAVRFPQDAGGKSAPAGTVKRRDPDGGEC